MNLKITHKVTLLGLGAFVLTALALILILRSTLPPALSELMLLEQQSGAQLLAAQAETALAERRQSLHYLGELLLDGEQLLPPTELNARLQQSVLGRQQFNGGLAVFNPAGIGIAEAPTGSNRIGLDVSDREHVQQARATRRPVITRPLISRSLGLPSFFINVPLINPQNEVIGFLVGVTILEVDNFLLSVGQEVSALKGLFYVLDEPNDLIVTATDPTLAMQPLPESGHNPLIDAVRSGIPSGQAKYRHGTDYIYATATVPTMGWTIVRAIPAGLIQKPVTELTWTLIFYALLLALLASLLLFALLRRLLEPLSTATQTINAMTAGQQTLTPLSVRSRDEVGQLVIAFNRLLQSLEDHRQRLYLATAGTGVGIWDYQVPSGQLLWDAQMLRLYGYAATDAEQHAYAFWERGVHPEDRDQAITALQKSLDSESQPFDTEFRVIHPDGDVRWIKANAVVLRDPQGRAVRMIGTNWDITEQKQAEILKNQFISTVSHELRTPLTSIRGALSLACHGQLGEIAASAQPMLATALKNTEHLTLLVNDLLDIEKLAAGKVDFDLQVQALIPLLEQSLDSSQAYADHYQVTLRLEPLAPSLQVRVDTQRFCQVMHNLLSNAIKFSPTHGEVSVTVTQLAQRVEVAVQDQGPGVPPEFAGRIFQRFAQADGSDTRKKGGTGLGLAISKEIIVQMDGEIGYDVSRSSGARFYFSLPLVTNSPNST